MNPSRFLLGNLISIIRNCRVGSIGLPRRRFSSAEPVTASYRRTTSPVMPHCFPMLLWRNYLPPAISFIWNSQKRSYRDRFTSSIVT